MLIFTVLMLATAFAEPKTAAEWATQLDETLKNQPGYLAHYHSTMPKVELKGIIGLDRESGVGFARFDIEKDGNAITGKSWSVENGDYFVDAMGTRGFLPGQIPEIDSLRKLFPGSKLDRSLSAPSLLLEGDGVVLNYMVSLSELAPETAWLKPASEGTLGGITAQSVTFQTKEFGTLVIDRKTGLIREQTITDSKGIKRVLQLDDFKINPGKEALVDISSDWRVAGAKSMLDPNILIGSRHEIFQQLIEVVGEGKMPMSDLDEFLAQPALMDLCREIWKQHPDSIPPDHILKEVLRAIKDEAQKKWNTNAPTGEKSDLAFLKFFNTQGFRDQIATRLTENYTSRPEKVEVAMGLLFGQNPPFEATSELAQEASKKVQDATVMAYYRAPLYSTMTDLWGEPEPDPVANQKDKE
ncbi:hypothetical protein JIN85_02625 [Luteolibacter pohnpeiensis]|uniref:DUF945 domain-containing protein n=1 Tax=Luteolibacter pohnpeiensis TaxID=454153 RepID=A0A934S2L4_9BACT|nr:hypothetical protein [Luteolibacter pohnpeiensis]MBK1881291.1 hypothetical protein [Luteolibacter pohnpeiensis]